MYISVLLNQSVSVVLGVFEYSYLSIDILVNFHAKPTQKIINKKAWPSPSSMMTVSVQAFTIIFDDWESVEHVKTISRKEKKKKRKLIGSCVWQQSHLNYADEMKCIWRNNLPFQAFNHKTEMKNVIIIFEPATTTKTHTKKHDIFFGWFVSIIDEISVLSRNNLWKR